MLGAVEPVRVATPAGPVAVHVLGAGLPTMLWHGLYVDGASWGYLIPALLPGRRLLVVDAPGWGRSGRPTRHLGRGDLVVAAAAVARALAPGSAVDWVGSGTGGRLGLALAAAEPALVRSVVAAMADPAPMPAAERRRLRPLLAGLALVGPVGGIGRRIVAAQLSPASRTEPQTVGAVLDALLLAGRIRAARSAARFDLHRPDLTPVLPRVLAPALLIASDDDGPWPSGAAEGAAALLPFGRVATVPGARTLLPLDRPDAMGRLVTEFWASLAAPPSR